MKKKHILTLLSFILIVVEATPVFAELKMGIFPRRPVALTNNMFTPLAQKLSKELGKPVKLIVAKNFKSYWEGVVNKEYDITHFNQYHYLLSHKNFGYNVIAVNEEMGSSSIAGAIAVRHDSGINNLNDLKGKTILFGGGKKAMVSYIAPTFMLMNAGLVADHDYTVKFANNPPNAMIALYNKASDAAGVGNVVLNIKSVTSKIDSSQIKILAESEPFIQLPWVVKDSMSDETKQKVQLILTSLKGTDDGDEILKSMRVTNLQPATDAEFSKVREIVKFTLGEDL